MRWEDAREGDGDELTWQDTAVGCSVRRSWSIGGWEGSRDDGAISTADVDADLFENCF